MRTDYNAGDEFSMPEAKVVNVVSVGVSRDSEKCGQFSHLLIVKLRQTLIEKIEINMCLREREQKCKALQQVKVTVSEKMTKISQKHQKNKIKLGVREKEI